MIKHVRGNFRFMGIVILIGIWLLVSFSAFSQSNSSNKSKAKNKKEINDTVQMIFGLKDKTIQNRKEKLEKILEIMRYRIASFRINRTITQLKDDKIYVNVPIKNNIKRIEKLLAEKGNMGIYSVVEGRIKGKIVYPRFGGKPIRVEEEPIITNYAIKDIKIAELTNKNFLIVFILNPLARRQFEEATSKLKGKKVALVISDRWVNISLVKEPISSGQIAFPLDYPFEDAMVMLSAISLGAYPAAIQLESAIPVPSPFVYPHQ